MISRMLPNASTSTVGHVHDWNDEIITVSTYCQAQPGQGDGLEIFNRER